MLRDIRADTPSARFARQGARVRADTLLGLARSFVASGDEAETRPELRHFSSIALSLLPYVDLETRAEVANLLAGAANAPREVIFALAQDAIEAAGPVLEQSALLDEGELAGIIRRESVDHARAIARRETILPTIADALTMRGDAEINAIIEERHGKDMLTERPSDLKPGKRAKRLPRAADALPDATLAKIFWAGSQDTRDAVMTIYTRRKGQGLCTLHERFGDLSAGIGSALVQLAGSKRVEDLIAGLARVADINRAQAARILADPGGEPLALLLAGIGMERDAANALIAAMTPGKPALQARLSALLGSADRSTAGRLALSLAGGTAAVAAPKQARHAPAVVNRPGVRTTGAAQAVAKAASRTDRRMPQTG